MFEPGIQQRPAYFHFDLPFSISIPFGHALGACSNGVLTLKNKTKKQKDEIGRYAPSDWPKSQNEAEETGWARFRFSLLLHHFFDGTKPKKQKS